MGDLACACLGLFSLAIVGISPGRGPDALRFVFLACMPQTCAAFAWIEQRVWVTAH